MEGVVDEALLGCTGGFLMEGALWCHVVADLFRAFCWNNFGGVEGVCYGMGGSSQYPTYLSHGYMYI